MPHKPGYKYFFKKKKRKGEEHGLYLVPKEYQGKTANGKRIDYGTHGCTLCVHTRVILEDNTVVCLSNYEDGKGRTIYCPFESCPYEDELSQYKSYDDYDRAERIKWKNKNWSI